MKDCGKDSFIKIASGNLRMTKVSTFDTKCSKYTNYPINKINYEKNLLKSFECDGCCRRNGANSGNF